MEKNNSVGKYLRFLLMLVLLVIGCSSFTVSAAAATPSAEKTKLTLYTGYKTETITLVNTDAAAKISWSSSDKSVATVKKGVVTPVAPGTAKITAKVTQSGKTYNVKVSVTVKKPYMSFSSKPASSLKVGESFTLATKAYGFKKGTLSWSSSDKGTVKVSSKGKLTALKEGTAKITAKDKETGIKVSVTVTVKGGAAPTATPTPKVAEDNIDSHVEELYKSREVYLDSILSAEVLNTSEDVLNHIYSRVHDCIGEYSVVVKDLSIVQSEEYYRNKFLMLESFDFTKVTEYKNCLELRVKSHSDMYYEDFATMYALTNNDTSKLLESEKELYKEAKRVADLCKADTDFDTVKNIHDYLINSIKYTCATGPDHYVDDLGRYMLNSVYTVRGALINHECVCDGYSKSVLVLTNACGIPSKRVIGYGNGGLHSWNVVQVDGVWYQIDVTWDDPVNSEGKDSDTLLYDYFLVSDRIMKEKHEWDSKGLPEATDDRYINFFYSQYPKLDGPEDLLKNLSNSSLVSGDEVTFLTRKVLMFSDMGAFTDTIFALHASHCFDCTTVSLRLQYMPVADGYYIETIYIDHDGSSRLEEWKMDLVRALMK